MKAKRPSIWFVILPLLVVVGAGIFLWQIYGSDMVSSFRNRKASIYWHKNVNPWDLQQVQDYCKKFDYNDDYYIICDFGRASGKKRFYVYNLNNKQRIMRSYCMHGNGGGSTDERPVFSNDLGSNCSSVGLFALQGLGSYRIKNSIKLTGLDKTNSMAYARGLLIHASKKTARFHGESKYIPIGKESHGCFTVSPKCLAELKTIYALHGKRKKILMWACG